MHISSSPGHRGARVPKSSSDRPKKPQAGGAKIGRHALQLMPFRDSAQVLQRRLPPLAFPPF
jgi:hypothetical protein